MNVQVLYISFASAPDTTRRLYAQVSLASLASLVSLFPPPPSPLSSFSLFLFFLFFSRSQFSSISPAVSTRALERGQVSDRERERKFKEASEVLVL